jgi:hypothetical protein
MRKTRLLLDAVLAAGRQDVTFCALDLCQQSLSSALQALQGEPQPMHGSETCCCMFVKGRKQLWSRSAGPACNAIYHTFLRMHDDMLLVVWNCAS